MKKTDWENMDLGGGGGGAKAAEIFKYASEHVNAMSQQAFAQIGLHLQELLAQSLACHHHS